MTRCQYIVSYYSTFFRSTRSTGYPDKKTADRDAAALKKEGALNIRVLKYTPVAFK